MDNKNISRRQFFGKSILASALAGAWMTTPVATKAVAENNANTAYKAPELSDKDAWSLVLIPDLQSYMKFERNQGIAELMIAWISENIEKLHILSAFQLGDLVEFNGVSQEEVTPKDAARFNQSSAQMWGAVSRVLSRLDGKLPYVVCTGNHDYGTWSAENRSTQFPTYFPAYRNSKWNGVLVECCRNRDGNRTLENAAYEFTTPQGKKLLVISLEFAPSDPVLKWAKELAAKDVYKDHVVMIITHSYLLNILCGNNWVEKEGYKVADANYGKAIWEKLVYPSPNIRFVFCGHIADPSDPRGGVGFRQDKNCAGKTVSQMLFDTQALGGGWHGNGGEGWLRLLEFSPDFKKVSVKTFSPLFAISPTTQQFSFDRAPYNEFTFDIDAD